ncbi:hypothetical protein [Phosphitispora sp. TUW77]|uniref:hypothetical protein n=1 Tax=Phosphitispora sp. TUW77 TaxID=3152361 RepID=UPI003AB57366
MPMKRCVLCGRPAYTTAVIGISEKKWVCSSCRAFIKKRLTNETWTGNSTGGLICKNCTKRRDNQCRFTAAERQKIIKCSDWESKNFERSKRRWAKFEQE